MTEKEFLAAVQQRQILNEQKKQLEDQVRELTDGLTAYKITHDLKTVAAGHYNVTYTERKTNTLKKELLLAAGVSADQIATSTVTTVSQSVTIRQRGE